MNDYLLTGKELSEIMKVSPDTIKTWVHRNVIPQKAIFKLPYSKKGTIRFIKNYVIEWISKGDENDNT